MEYYFGEHLRWSLGWETPNQAGAFLATLLPFAWGLVGWLWSRSCCVQASHRRWLWALLALVFFAAESAGFYVLARTYSRGALVGLGGAALVWGALVWWRGRSKAACAESAVRTSAMIYRNFPWLARAVVVVVCLTLTGFHARLAPGHVAEDRSSLNRLVLWQGGAELVAASPLRGWGWGESGAAFMHWTQPLDRNEGYLSMVNSYLTVAVDTGLPRFSFLFALALLPLSLVVVAGRRGRRGEAMAHAPDAQSPLRPSRFLALFASKNPALLTVCDYALCSCVAAWSAWLGCMVFSNLWIIRPLWIAPGLAALLGLLLCQGRRRDWGHASAWALVGALSASAALWLMGAILARRAPLEFERAADGSVVMRGRMLGTREVWVVPDAAVLGDSYGQELRRWLLAAPELGSIRVYSAVGDLPRAAQAEPAGLVLCGAAASAVGEVPAGDTPRVVWLLHPTEPPPGVPPRLAAGSRITLPGIDLTGRAADWWAWAAQPEPPLPVEVSGGLASDARPRWPEIAHGFPPFGPPVSP